ncbi:hypothetical protein [Streptacidiphilus sp. PAMC 29251]
MTHENVNSVADKYGLDYSDINVELRKSTAGLGGITKPDKTVQLARGAFQNEETLAKTLAHEQFHVNELNAGMPYPTSAEEAIPFEDRAYAFEDTWWAAHPLNPLNQQ